MVRRTPPEATDQVGHRLPASPTVDALVGCVDGLRIVSDEMLASDTITRVPFDELERRRRRALGR